MKKIAVVEDNPDNRLLVQVIRNPFTPFDAAHWWRSSEGVREILGESIAYLYAKFIFHPALPPK